VTAAQAATNQNSGFQGRARWFHLTEGTKNRMLFAEFGVSESLPETAEEAERLKRQKKLLW
jgi:hypothetical protein